MSSRENLAPDGQFEGAVARAEGNTERATAAFLEAREGCESRMRDHPHDPRYIAQAAETDAALGRRQEAVSEIDKALELQTDPLDRVGILITEATVYSRLGDRERALSKLEGLAHMTFGIDYGSLRFDPEWDALRDDPRFAKIVSSLQPQP